MIIETIIRFKTWHVSNLKLYVYDQSPQNPIQTPSPPKQCLRSKFWPLPEAGLQLREHVHGKKIFGALPERGRGSQHMPNFFETFLSSNSSYNLFSLT